MKTYSFLRGGVSYDDPTVPSTEKSAAAFLPIYSVIPLTQQGGKVSPVVSIGDTVKEGMLIGKASGHHAANVHATVPGRVIRNITWEDSSGRPIDAFVIKMEGSFDRLGRHEEIFPWTGMSGHELQRVIAEYGVVEMEGSGKPVSELISSFRNKGEHLTLVVRCVFDDPWLAADNVLCKERLKEVVEGSFIMAKAGIKVGRIVFAVSSKEQALGESLLFESASGNIPASLVLVGSRYPQRNHRELEQVLQAFSKNEGIELGSLLILGPATMAAVYDAVKLKKPTLDRYIAVGGSAVKCPQVLKVRIGTRLAEVFAECGGFSAPPQIIAEGSPLNGRIVTNLNQPVLKTSYAFYAMKNAQATKWKEQNCISCGECRSVCPVGLDPEELYKQAIMNNIQKVTAECHNCGCCQIVCPSHLPLATVIMEKFKEQRHG